jgi:hypothetical protein
MLLERGMPKEALVAFEATLKKESNRRGATIGATKAAEKSGDMIKARQYYGKIAGLSAAADRGRPELADARAFNARHRSKIRVTDAAPRVAARNLRAATSRKIAGPSG